MLIKKKERCGTQNRKVLFLRNNFFIRHISNKIWVVLLYRYDSSTISESLKAVTLTEAELQAFMCRKITSGKFTGPRFRNRAAVQHDQIMHTACIGELNAMHFKQTINLPQEHSNYTSCHELCPYDVNIAMTVSVS